MPAEYEYLMPADDFTSETVNFIRFDNTTTNPLVVMHNDNALNFSADIQSEKLDKFIAATNKEIEQLKKEVAELKRQLPQAVVPEDKSNHLDTIL